MGLMDGKRGLVFGIANDYSIAWAITEQLHKEGATLGFTHLPDRDPANPKMERRVRKLVDPIGSKMLVSCDVQQDADLDKTFSPVFNTVNSACERTEHEATPQRVKWRLICMQHVHRSKHPEQSSSGNMRVRMG